MSPSSQTSAKTPLLTDKAYTFLKHLAAVGLPAISTLYIALATAWHWPDTSAVVASIGALNVLAGGTMAISSNAYNNAVIQYAGNLLVKSSGAIGAKPTLAVELETAAENLFQMGEVLLRVKPQTGLPGVDPGDTTATVATPAV